MRVPVRSTERYAVLRDLAERVVALGPGERVAVAVDGFDGAGKTVLADQVTAGLEGMTVPLRVAVMGCVVNGPGEAREADLGVASGNGKGQIFVKGEVIKTVPEAQIVETLIEEAMRLAEEMGEPVDEESAGAPSVSVS